MGIHLVKRKRYAMINEAFKSVMESMEPEIARNISRDYLIRKLKEKLVKEYGFNQEPSTRTIYRAFNMCPELRREIALWKIEKSLKGNGLYYGDR